MHLYCVCQILVFHAINIIVTDMDGNIRIDRLSLDHGTDRQTDISLASGNIMFTVAYHDLKTPDVNNLQITY